MSAWAEHHPWMTCVLAGLAILLASNLLNNILAVLPGRVLRSRNIKHAGWPPAHLDADGDWKPRP